LVYTTIFSLLIQIFPIQRDYSFPWDLLVVGVQFLRDPRKHDFTANLVRREAIDPYID